MSTNKLFNKGYFDSELACELTRLYQSNKGKDHELAKKVLNELLLHLSTLVGHICKLTLGKRFNDTDLDVIMCETLESIYLFLPLSITLIVSVPSNGVPLHTPVTITSTSSPASNMS